MSEVPEEFCPNIKAMIREQVAKYNSIINSDGLEGGRLEERGAIIAALTKTERQNCMLYNLKRDL